MNKSYSGWSFLFILSVLLISPNVSAQDSTLVPKIKTATGKDKIELLNKFAASFVYRNPQERLRISKETLSGAEKIHYPKGIADALNNCGISYYYLREYNLALGKYIQALPIFLSIGDSNAVGGIYNNIANIYQKRRIIDSAIIYNKKALEVRRKLGSDAAVATSVTNLGLLNLMESNYKNALENFREALRIRRKDGRKLSIASSLNNIGALYWNWGNLSSALEYFEEALKLSTEEGYTHGIVMAELNIGLINIDLGELDFARKYIDNAIQEADSSGIPQGKANGYYYLAILNNKSGNWDKSLALIKTSHTYFKKVNDNNALSVLYTLEAKNYLMKKELEKASNSVQKAMAEAKRANNKTLIASAYQVMGQLELSNGDYSKALSNTELSLKINENKHRLENIVADFKQLSDIYMKMGNYRVAADYLEKYASSKDSLFNQKLAGNISNWRVKYETANKENKILKLNKENTLHLAEISQQKTLAKFLIIITLLVLFLLAVLFYFYYNNKKKNSLIGKKNKQLDELNSKLEEQNLQLLNSNKTKDKLFSIIAHDLKAPFNGLLGLSSILSDEIDRMTKDEIIEMSKMINNSSDKLYNLTKNLLDWSRLQIESIKASPEKLDVRNVFDELKDTMNSALEEKNILLNTETGKDAELYCDPQLLETILRNLISNSIKFTNQGGEIRLIAQNENGGIKFRIIDNGVGMEPEILERIFMEDEFYTTNGTEGEHGTGLGLKICKELVEKCEGQIKVNSEVGKGTEFSFVLPKEGV